MTMHIVEIATLPNLDPKIVWDQDLRFTPVCLVETDHPEKIPASTKSIVQEHCRHPKFVKQAQRGRYQSKELIQRAGLVEIHFIRVRELSESEGHDVPVLTLDTSNELVSQIETDQLADALVIPREPVADDESFIYCEACKNTDPKCVTGVEFAYDSPLRYDGVSEWHCKKCGARTGRWSRLILREGESERPHGRGMRTQ